MAKSQKYLRAACIAALVYVGIVLLNTLITYSWLKSERELFRGIVRVVGVSAVVFFVWRGDRRMEKIFFWGSAVLSVLSLAFIFVLLSPDILVGRPYILFDQIMMGAIPLSMISTFVLAWMSRRAVKSQ